ncbi:hypothetical protein [Methylobacterium sp. SyP6R]|uniref:hypothetical protein n=1 Tax=Methylobacterium sp. SyP6R TaxID=2718876 RepID=UPI001F35BCFA|nr:hypothetical protein [Methylobacterium sp. SyP6R]MCF4129937.1 hypothetical protein [Methylobacterium sp. SyP6R]
MIDALPNSTEIPLDVHDGLDAVVVNPGLDRAENPGSITAAPGRRERRAASSGTVGSDGPGFRFRGPATTRADIDSAGSRERTLTLDRVARRDIEINQDEHDRSAPGRELDDRTRRHRGGLRARSRPAASPFSIF